MKYFALLLTIFSLNSLIAQENIETYDSVKSTIIKDGSWTRYLDSNTCLNGPQVKYYSNGKIKKMKTYRSGFLYGPYEKYYRNGRIKEKGFLDDVNCWTILFQPSKMIKEKFNRKGKIKKSVKGKIIDFPAVPSGKCECTDGNLKLLQTLLIGTWKSGKMYSFDHNQKVLDSIIDNYKIELTFYPDFKLQKVSNGKIEVGRYELTSNTLQLFIITESNKSENIMSFRWPKKTLFPNNKNECFNLELIELLEVIDTNNKRSRNNGYIKFEKKIL